MSENKTEMKIIRAGDINKHEAIQMALAHNRKLNMIEFISTIGYADSNVMSLADKWWMSLRYNRIHYVDSYLLGQIGLTVTRETKRDFINKLERPGSFEYGYDYVIYDNDEFKPRFNKNTNLFYTEGVKNRNFFDCVQTQSTDDTKNNSVRLEIGSSFTWKGQGKSKHVLIKSKAIKEITMILETEKAKKFRVGLLALEELVYTFCDYEKEYVIKAEREAKAQLQLESRQAIEERDKAIEAKERAEQKANEAIDGAKKFYDSILSKLKPGKPDQKIYIKADSSTIRRHTAKIGGTVNERRRDYNYDVGRTSDNKLETLKTYDCHNYTRAEHFIRGVMGDCRENQKREMYTLPIKQMKHVMDTTMMAYKCITGIMNEVIDNIEELSNDTMSIDQAKQYFTDDDKNNPMTISRFINIMKAGYDKSKVDMNEEERKENGSEEKESEEKEEIGDPYHNMDEKKETEGQQRPYVNGDVYCCQCGSDIKNKTSTINKHKNTTKHRRSTMRMANNIVNDVITNG